MRERVVQFGAGSSLTGILTEPAGRADAAGTRPAILLLNSGVLHRVGACRLHVKIARALAERGFTSLRFDFSGIGDSLGRKDTLPFEKSSVLEVKEAMKLLESQRGARSFVLIGLCSGADASLFTALEEPRAVGLVQIDAFAYRTPRWYVNHYSPRLLDAGTWRRALEHPSKTLQLLLKPGAKLTARAAAAPKAEVGGPEAAQPSDADAPEYVRVFPPRAWWRSSLRTLVARDVKQYYIFTNGMSEHYNYAEQFIDGARGIDLRGTVKVLYAPECDHLITERAHQAQVVDSIRDWATATWAGGAQTGAPKEQAPGAGRTAAVG